MKTSKFIAAIVLMGVFGLTSCADENSEVYQDLIEIEKPDTSVIEKDEVKEQDT